MHLDVSLRARYLAGEGSWAVTLVGEIDGQVRAASLQTLPSPTCTSRGTVVTGQRLIFEDDVRPSDLAAPMTIEATVIDGAGAQGAATLSGVIVTGL